MTTYYSPGCINEKAHTCNNCSTNDGRPTLCWEKEDFDLCHECIEKLWVDYSSKILHHKPIIIIKRAIINEELRNKIFKRDGFKCVSCLSEENLSIDHILPFIKGGMAEPCNLQTLCRTCNSKKGGK